MGQNEGRVEAPSSQCTFFFPQPCYTPYLKNLTNEKWDIKTLPLSEINAIVNLCTSTDRNKQMHSVHWDCFIILSEIQQQIATEIKNVRDNSWYFFFCRRSFVNAYIGFHVINSQGTRRMADSFLKAEIISPPSFAVSVVNRCSVISHCPLYLWFSSKENAMSSCPSPPKIANLYGNDFKPATHHSSHFPPQSCQWKCSAIHHWGYLFLKKKCYKLAFSIPVPWHSIM